MLKFLTQEEWDLLKSKKEKKDRILSLSEQLKSKTNELANYKKETQEYISGLKREFKIELEDLHREIKNVKAEQDLKVKEKTSELNQELVDALRDKDIAVAKADMLTKAFEGLGFDVKDMKDILEKLVDGLVAKNQIQILKTK